MTMLVKMKTLMKTLMRFHCFLVLALMLACGGPEEARGPSAKASAERPTEAPKAEPTKAEKANEIYSDFAKEVDELPKGKPIDKEWLKKRLNEVLAVDPQHCAARFNLAVLTEQNGGASQARQQYEEILESCPNFAPAAENVAAFQVESGQVDEAEETYKRLIEADPKALTSRMALARIYQSRGQHKKAIDQCRRVLQRKADAIEAFRILASSYWAVKDAAMAQLIIGRGLKVDPEDVQLHYLTAQILLAQDKLSDGVAKLKQVVTLKPKWLKVRAQLAGIALSYNDFGNAAQQYEAIIKEAPGDRAAKLGLAVSYKGLGRFEQAEKLYQELLAKNRKDADALWNLGMLYWRHLKRYDDSVGILKEFASAAPSGDKDAARVSKIVAKIEHEKKDVAARKAREERERKRAEAIAAACEAIATGKPLNAEAIGNNQARIQAAWDLLLVDAVGKMQEGAIEAAQTKARCALAIVPNTPGAGAVACAQLRVNWVQIEAEVGLLTTIESMKSAKAMMEEALKCDPDNPEVQLILQQLDELIKQQQGG